MIRLLDLPGAQQLQARLELCPGLAASNDAKVRQLLGLMGEALGFTVDWSGWLELPDLEPGEQEIDIDRYRIDECDAGQVEFWRKRGWDIAGPDGKAVRFFGMIWTAVVIIDEGRCGRSKTGVEAALWKLQRDERAPVDPKVRKHDRSFLDLGRGARRARSG